MLRKASKVDEQEAVEEKPQPVEPRLLTERNKRTLLGLKKLIAVLWLYEAKKLCVMATQRWNNLLTPAPKPRRAPRKGLFFRMLRKASKMRLTGSTTNNQGNQDTDDSKMRLWERWRGTRLHLIASYNRLQYQLWHFIYSSSNITAKKFVAREAAFLVYRRAWFGRRLGQRFYQPAKIVSKYPSVEWVMVLDTDLVGKDLNVYQRGRPDTGFLCIL